VEGWLVGDIRLFGVLESFECGICSLRTAIYPPMKRRGHVIFDLCTPAGKIERWTVPRSYSLLGISDSSGSSNPSNAASVASGPWRIAWSCRMSSRRDYCHFEQRYIRPPFLQRIMGAKDRNHEDLKFSIIPRSFSMTSRWSGSSRKLSYSVEPGLAIWRFKASRLFLVLVKCS
jgi:hypothetical protein